MAYVVKAAVDDVRAETFVFAACKTMYGGKRIVAGDAVFVFASENHGGTGLIACGVATAVAAVDRPRGVARWTPRVDLAVRRTGVARRRLGRTELKGFSDWGDGRPETELNFKLYRQATDKLVGIEAATAALLATYCGGL